VQIWSRSPRIYRGTKCCSPPFGSSFPKGSNLDTPDYPPEARKVRILKPRVFIKVPRDLPVQADHLGNVTSLAVYREGCDNPARDWYKSCFETLRF
jgi:hypothetical protein